MVWVKAEYDKNFNYQSVAKIVKKEKLKKQPLELLNNLLREV